MLQEGHAKGELENNFEWGGDFGAPDETYLSNQFGQPIFVHHFPAAIKGVLFRDATRNAPNSLSVSTCSRPKATARSSAAANARLRSGISGKTDRSAQPAEGIV